MILTSDPVRFHFIAAWLSEYTVSVAITVSAGVFLGAITWATRFITKRVSAWLKKLDANDKAMANSIAAVRRVNRLNHQENTDRFNRYARVTSTELKEIRERLAAVERKIQDGGSQSGSS